MEGAKPRLCARQMGWGSHLLFFVVGTLAVFAVSDEVASPTPIRNVPRLFSRSEVQSDRARDTAQTTVWKGVVLVFFTPRDWTPQGFGFIWFEGR